MNVLGKFLHSVSYKFPKGYPDIKSEQDILMLESLLYSRGININLREATTSATEDLHEIFTALFVVGHQPVDDIFTADWDAEIKKLGNKLLEPEKHANKIKEYIGDGKMNKDEYKGLYKDAQNISNKLISRLDDIEQARRVFADSTKEKADIYVYQKGRNKEGLGVSLKYGEGQFNSLSPTKVLKDLFGLEDLEAVGDVIDDQGNIRKKSDGVLTQITKENPSAKKEIDRGAQGYIKFIIDNYKKPKEISNPEKNTKAYLDGTFKSKSKTSNPLDNKPYYDIIDGVAQSKLIPVKTKIVNKEQQYEEVPIKDITWEEWSKANLAVQKAFSKAYNASPLTVERSKVVVPLKNDTINKVVKDYIEKSMNEEGFDLNTKIDGESDEGQQIKKFLVTILGAGDKSYYYIGKGGDKSTFIPSIKRLNDLDYYIQPKFKESGGDFVIDLDIYGKTTEGVFTLLFSTDVKLRFAGSGGQFAGDITQKGSTFKIGKNGDDINMEKAFGF